MPGATFIEGDKVNLRTIEEEDLEFMRESVNDAEVRVDMGNKRPKNMEAEKQFFEENLSGSEDPSLMICSDGERIGIVKITREEDESDKVGKLGIWLHPDHHGEGYGTEACELIIDYGFNQLNLHKLYARAHQDNKASQKLWEKLGFEKEGVLREQAFLNGEYKYLFYYGILEDEWE